MTLDFNDFQKQDVKFNINELQKAYNDIIKIKNFAKEGDTIVVVAGMPFGISGSTNSIRVVEI